MGPQWFKSLKRSWDQKVGELLVVYWSKVRKYNLGFNFQELTLLTMADKYCSLYRNISKTHEKKMNYFFKKISTLKATWTISHLCTVTVILNLPSRSNQSTNIYKAAICWELKTEGYLSCKPTLSGLKFLPGKIQSAT